MEFVVPYKDFTYLTLTPVDTSPARFWGSEYILQIKLIQNSSTIATLKIPESRCIAYLGCLEDLIVLVRLDYIDDQSSVAMDFYQIIENEIQKVNAHVVNSDFTIGNTEIHVQKIGNNKFVVIWSDLCNYEYLQMCTFSRENYTLTSFDWKIYEEVGGNFCKTCMISKDQILYSRVIAFDKKYLMIIIKNLHDSSITTFISNLQICDHNFDKTEVDSSIVEFRTNNFEQYLLIKVEMQERLNVLTLKNVTKYILLQAKFNVLEFVEVSEATNFQPSIIFKNDKAKIFNEIS